MSSPGVNLGGRCAKSRSFVRSAHGSFVKPKPQGKTTKLYSLAVLLPLLPFLEYPDITLLFCTSTKAQKNVNMEKLERFLFSRVKVFDRTHYLKYWGVEITDEFDPQKIDIRALRAFLKTYYGPNPIGNGRVKDVCLMPTVVPKSVVRVGEIFDFNLNLLGQLAEQPGGEGHKAKYLYVTDVLEQHGTDRVEKACLVILLKGVVAREQSWPEQVQFLRDLNTQCGCEVEPDAPSQNTVLMAHHAVTGERPFGNHDGMEGRWTYGRTRELVQYGENAYHMVSGGFSARLGFARAELNVGNDHFVNEDSGVGILRKF